MAVIGTLGGYGIKVLVSRVSVHEWCRYHFKAGQEMQLTRHIILCPSAGQ